MRVERSTDPGHERTSRKGQSLHLRQPRPAHRARRERDELLRDVPDRRAAARRPRALAPAQSRLAEDAGGDGGGEAKHVMSDNRRGMFLLAIAVFFAAYIVFALEVPPADHDCTAHFFPNYVPVRIAIVFAWLILSWLVWEYSGRSWFWKSFFVGTLAGGGFMLVAFPINWLVIGLTDVFHWIRVLSSTMSYAIIAGFFTGNTRSLTRSLIFGLSLFFLQVIVDDAIRRPGFCVY